MQAQTRFWQLWPVSQRAQACPPVPQSWPVFPGWQRPLSSQQPLGQLCGVQTHCPCALQVLPSPAGQGAHGLPSTPQTGGVLGRHRPGVSGPCSQQPAQSPARQTQTWSRHEAPTPQLTQLAPPLPQKSSTFPVRQMAPPLSEKQHPVGQLCASQTHWPLPLQRRPRSGGQGGEQATHCWSRHPSPEAQAAQATPPVPQAWMVSPGWQRPLAQQPSGQLCGVQRHWPVSSSQTWLAWQVPQVPVPPQPSPPHTRLVQLGAQHNPSGLHWLSGPAQQSMSLAQQPVPRGEQAMGVPPAGHWLTGAAQTKLKQLPEQHWPPWVQAVPFGRQGLGLGVGPLPGGGPGGFPCFPLPLFFPLPLPLPRLPLPLPCLPGPLLPLASWG